DEVLEGELVRPPGERGRVERLVERADQQPDQRAGEDHHHARVGEDLGDGGERPAPRLQAQRAVEPHHACCLLRMSWTSTVSTSVATNSTMPPAAATPSSPLWKPSL